MKSRIIIPFRFANYIPYKINAEISTAKWMCAQQIVHRNNAYINETIRCIRDQLTLCGSCMLIYLYINVRSRDGTFMRPSGVQAAGGGGDSFSLLWTGFTLTVHINALHNESVHGKEEHATWIDTDPLEISHLFAFTVSNWWSRRDSRVYACIVGDTSPLLCSHGSSFPYVHVR